MTLHTSYSDPTTGELIEIEGESVEAIAAELPVSGVPTVTVYDEPGFVRGWARSPSDWRAN